MRVPWKNFLQAPVRVYNSGSSCLDSSMDHTSHLYSITIRRSSEMFYGGYADAACACSASAASVLGAVCRASLTALVPG